MAQYYNFVTNASGTLTLEEVQRLCSVDGQSVQLVVEDLNNGGNGSQQFLAYTAAPQNREQTILSQQTINLGSQVSTTQLDQGPNVYIIKTNEVPTGQNIIKTNTVNPPTVGENIINILENTGAKTSNNTNNDGQELQWVKMPENSINVDVVPQQSILISEKSQTANLAREQIQNNTTSTLPVHVSSELQQYTSGPIDKKPSKLLQNKNRQSTASAQSVSSSITSITSDGTHVAKVVDGPIKNSNVSNNKTVIAPFRNRVTSPVGQNVTPTYTRQIRAICVDPSLARPTEPFSPKNSLKLHQPEMEHLSERIKQAKLKLQNQGQTPIHSENRTQQSSTQRQVAATGSQVGQTPLKTSMQQQQISSSTVQHKQQQATSSAHLQQMQKQLQERMQKTHIASEQKSVQQKQGSISSPTHGTMEVDSTDPPASPSSTDCERSAGRSVAYLQEIISNPALTLVQHQVQGNSAKMLVLLSNGEQRIIGFDIPDEKCTVQDLLEEANITFCGEIAVSFVVETTFGINYIVEAGPGSLMTIQEGGDHSDGNSSQLQDNTSTTSDNLSQNINAADENSNSSSAQNEEAIYIEGKLALCPHCGIGSVDFSRCLRCKTRFPRDVKAIPMTANMQEKKENMLSVDTCYKKTHERYTSTKLDRLERDGSTSKRGRGRGRTTTARSRPVNREPECLTISSDEEDENKTKKAEGVNSNTGLANANNIFNDDSDTILGKEPIITNNTVMSPVYMNNSEETVKGEGRECDGQHFVETNVQSLHTGLLCRTVRIGSYKYAPKEKVVVSHSGVRFSIPLLEDDTAFVTLDIKIQELIKVLIHFGKSMPVLFFYTSTHTGAMIRELLGMQDPKGPYYDPASKDNTHKRITLLPERLSDESKAILRNLFMPYTGLLEELSPKEANDILVRASPMDNVQIQALGKRHSQTSAANNNSVNGNIQTITVYPPPPAKGGIAINTEDYMCLSEDQFLNDVIIDFYLKYLTLEVLSETDRHRTHVFSSFFYKRLTSPHTQAGESGVPLTAPAKRHARVQKWTKNVNIFEKDFIIIPINEHAHWFLAIICFPGMVGKVLPSTVNTKEEDDKSIQKSKKLKDMKFALTIGTTTISPVTTTITIDHQDDGSERDEAEGDDEEMEMDSDEDEEAELQEDNKVPQPKLEPSMQEKDTVKVPCILIFDSLAGASRSRVVATLRDYLSCEHVAKMGTEKIFSKDTIKGASPKVPQQSNLTDCGLYVLQYVESFFKNSIKDYTIPIKTLKNWFAEIIVTRKREELSKLLIKLMNDTKGDKSINLPTVTFPTQDGKLKPKSENYHEAKSTKTESERKKFGPDGESQMVVTSPTATDSDESTTELVNRATYQIIPFAASTSSNSNETNSTEMLTEPKISRTRTSSETMSYLKAKRIPRLMSRTESQDDCTLAKKHKGESLDSCK